MVAFFTFLRKAAPPELFELITRGKYNYDASSLPLDPERYQFEGGKLGEGSESAVFKLHALGIEDPNYVIKLDRLSERGTVDQLVTRGGHMQMEYEECQEWYRNIPDFVPEEYRFIGKSPRGGEPALFTLQEYLGKGADIQDLFRGITKEKLLEELRDDSGFRENFRKIAQRTLELYQEHGRIIDTVGPKNVSLVETPVGKRLILLDPHVTSLPTDPKIREEKIKNLEADLQYLKEILNEIGSHEGANDSHFQQAA